MNTRALFLAMAAGIIVLASGIAFAKEQIPPRDRPVLERPVVSIAPTDTAPTVDGVLDDVCWQSAVSALPFNLCYQAEYAPFRSEALLTYDAEYLYVGMRCFQPDPERHPAPPYPPANAKATAEVLLNAGAKEQYYKLAITPEGDVTTHQWGGGAAPWHGEPTAAQARADGGWTAEFAIPFAALELPRPHPTGSWRVNFGRRRPNKIENAAWAVTYAWFYEPQFFGDLRFRGEDACTAELTEVSAPKVGANPLTLRLTNRAANSTECEVLGTMEEMSGRRTIFRKILRVEGGEHVDVPLSYELPDGTLGVLTVAVSERHEAAPLFRQSIPVNVPRNREMLHKARRALKTIKTHAGGERSPHWLSAELRRCRRELRAFDEALSRPNLPLCEWKRLEKPIERLLGQAEKLAWIQEHGVADASFAVGYASTIEKLLRDHAYQGPRASVIMLEAARGEYEGTQLVVVPCGDSLENLAATCSPLQGPDGHVIAPEEITLQWVDFVETRQPRHPIDYIGWFPDPLFPWDAASRSVPSDTLHQPIWLTVHVPHGIPPGTYTGQVSLEADEADPQTVTLRVRVYDFALPLRPALKTVFWLNDSLTRRWYGWEQIPHDVRRDQIAFLLRYRINPAIGLDLLEPVEDFEFALERGLNTIQLGTAASWPLPEDAMAKLEKSYAFLKARGLLDMAFIYAHDEPSPEMYPEVRHTMEQVAQHFPGLRRVCTAFPPAEGLEGAVETWIVVPNLFNYEAVAERQAAGDDLWFYGGPTAKRPYTNWYVDYAGIEERMIFWHCWKYGATGLLHWCLNYWGSNMTPWSGNPAIDDAIAAGERWPEVPWNAWTYLNVNGEAQLVYPGTDGAFWSSVRLEIFRDGMEDYDYLAVLKSLLRQLDESTAYNRSSLAEKGRDLITIGPPVAADLTEFTKDLDVLMQRRKAVAEHIERIKHALDAE